MTVKDYILKRPSKELFELRYFYIARCKKCDKSIVEKDTDRSTGIFTAGQFKTDIKFENARSHYARYGFVYEKFSIDDDYTKLTKPKKKDGAKPKGKDAVNIIDIVIPPPNKLELCPECAAYEQACKEAAAERLRAYVEQAAKQAAAG